MEQEAGRAAMAKTHIGWLTGWLLGRLQRLRRTPPRLAVLERITLAPRQSLALVEAEGRRFLVATSPEGTPAFYALDRERPARPATQSSACTGRAAQTGPALRKAARPGADRDLRVSW
jgi:flagellar biogenesis protein FliO